MGIAVSLRRDLDISYYRRFLHKIIQIPELDELILASGYVTHGKTYKVLDDELWERLRNAKGNSVFELKTIAGRFNSFTDQYAIWYGEFVSEIESRIGNFEPKWKYYPLIAKKRNWHAKIALGLSKGDPIACIIGSSNLTSTAYGERRSKGRVSLFNHECDVTIWKDDPIYDKIFLSDSPEEGQKERIDYSRSDAPMALIMNRNIRQQDESHRMRNLQKAMNDIDLQNYFDWRKNEQD